MLKTYITVAWRKLFQKPLLSAISIIGLAASLAVCLLIGLYNFHQLAGDHFERNYSRIALFRQFEQSAGSGGGFVKLIKNRPQVEQVTRVVKIKTLVDNVDRSIADNELNFCCVDSNFSRVFDLPLIHGSGSALTSPNQILLSEKMAAKYFANLDPVGKPLLLNGKQAVFVGGVFRDFPDNSHLPIDFIANFQLATPLTGQRLDGYWDNLSLTYVLLKTPASLGSLNGQLPAMIKQSGDANAAIWKPLFIPLKDIFLRSRLDDRVRANMAIDQIYIFSSIALFVLLIAVINYVNLSTAKFISFLKEIGIRKMVGADRIDLMQQLLIETALTVLLAGIVALLFASTGLPLFNKLSGSALTTGLLFSLPTLSIYGVLLLTFTFLAGLYPAFYLSSLTTANGLKQRLLQGSGGETVRKVFVFFQFNVSLVIVIAVAVVWKQLFFIHTLPLGYDREQVLTLTFPDGASPAEKASFLHQVSALASVSGTTICSPLPGSGVLNNKLVENYVPAGKDLSYQYIYADTSFLKVFGVRLLKGTFFSPSSRVDQHEFLVNRSMSHYLNAGEDPIGHPLAYYAYVYNADGTYKEVPVRGNIIGMIDDYHQSSLHSPIAPMLVQLATGYEPQAAIRIAGTDYARVVSGIGGIWKNSFPDRPFDYAFLDQVFDNHYRAEANMGRALTVFAALAIIISVLGLLGLTIIAVEKRQKEIAIRKVLGASAAGLVGLLSADFAKLLVLALLTAIPLSWTIMNKWLNNFAYRTAITWWLYLGSGLLLMIVAILTVGTLAYKATSNNPAKSLRID